MQATMPFFILVSALVLVLAGPASAAPDDAPCGPKSVWTLPREAFSRCLETSSDPSSCLISSMRQHGASPQAIACAKALEGEAFLGSLRPMGRIGLAMAEYPMRANSNTVPFLVGGQPPLVSSELPEMPDISGDPAYPALKKCYPDMTVWPGDATFRSMERLAHGDQGFVFAYPLRNGCHACALAGHALVSLRFDVKGVFKGPQLLRLEPAKQ